MSSSSTGRRDPPEASRLHWRAVWDLLRETYSEWSEDKAPVLGAALAYYTLFSLAPLLILVIAIAGLIFGERAVKGEIFGQIQVYVGPAAAETVEDLIESASRPQAGLTGTVLGLGMLLLGASGLLGQLKDALNTVWEARATPTRGVLAMIRGRARTFLISLAVVIGAGFLLILFLGASAIVNLLGGLFNQLVPGLAFFLVLANVLVSLAVITLLFALIFKVLPDVRIAWSDVWVGALATAVLFTIGKEFLGLYLARSGAGSAYGAAGSLVVILIWIYYSAQIFFFGAEFTQVYARRYGTHRGWLGAVAAGRSGHPDEGTPPTGGVEPERKRPRQGRERNGRSGAGSALPFWVMIALMALLVRSVAGARHERGQWIQRPPR